MASLFALLAALCFALGNVLQQKGTLETTAGADDPRFLLQIFRRPVWAAGAFSQGAGWVLQALALDRGPLALVQSLTTMSLVFSLPLGARLTHQQIGRRIILGASAVVVGVILFVSIGTPAPGTTEPSAAEWWAACLATLGLIAVFTAIGRRHRGAMSAALLGSAAGFAFGLQGAVTKVFVTYIGKGLHVVLGSWPTYVLVVTALVGLALQQAALKSGVLAPAIASANAVTLFTGVLLGVTLFNETLHRGGASRVPSIAGLCLAFIGVIVLASGGEANSEASIVDTHNRRH
jgi:drug/metabolite transporter (DMT)-like permease